MPLPPTNLLAKIEQLRKWQEEQQQRLVEEHQRRLQANEDSLDLSNPINLPNGNRSTQDRSENEYDNIKRKQPFLRRGAGLARFRMSAGDQFKPFNKTTHFSRSKSRFKKVTINNKNNSSDKSEATIITPLKTPNLVMQPLKANWCSTIDNTDNNEQESHCDADKENSYTTSQIDTITMNSSTKELLVFEALEKRAMQNSFCSTNSSIYRLLSSTPSKTLPSKPAYASHINNTQEEQTVQKVDADVITPQQITQSDYAQQEVPTTSNDVHIYEKQIQNEYLTLIEEALRFKQFVAGNVTPLSTESSSVTSEYIREDISGVQPNKPDDEFQWSDDVASNVSSNTDDGSAENTLHRNDEATTITTCEDAIQKKLAELKDNEETVRLKAIRVDKLKNELRRQQADFNRHKRELLKHVEEEKRKINAVLEEERKKLAKEKMVFDRYSKNIQNRPSKKEREEIALLRTEVATLKETLKLKETKHGTTQARLRNQIKNLEKENLCLREEIDNLNRKNGQLVATQRLSRPPSDTKLLHQINRHLTKLTQQKQTGDTQRSSLNENQATGLETIQSNQKEASEKENDLNAINSSDQPEEIPSKLQECHKTDRTEQIFEDGTKHIKYSNGNVKTISPNGNVIVFKYYNGDIKETNLLEGTIRYLYSDSKIRHITHSDGTEVVEFPDGQIEKRLKDGKREIHYPNGITRHVSEDGTEQLVYPDGTSVTTNADGEKILSLPNGQKEIHTKEHKRREYPDGTVKILYPDGLQETRYSNGRVRLKDKQGNLLMDSQVDV